MLYKAQGAGVEVEAHLDYMAQGVGWGRALRGFREGTGVTESDHRNREESVSIAFCHCGKTP